MSLPCGDMGAEKGDPINLFRPRIISSWAWSYFTVEKRKKTSISKFNSGVARFFLALGFDGGLKKPPTDALRPIIPDNACILCITAAAGTELADAYSPDTVIASSPGKEVHDPWAFYLHAALLRQAFAHCGKFPTAASRRSLGRVSVPVWLIILSDQLLIIALVLTRYSPVRHWKHHFPSDLHVLSMPPAFILSQDRTLHEIHSCITYSFLVRRQS
ncbi:ATP synthase subunit alpha [Melia azedarach]|nr:ATP synthase subunit alpha [Melia azedarach]KAJ4699503.1 ATP synthase subunit alpha [Melia azedarach]KAJ4699522.1 ATP synthase subunit alpha [Melia azedarach]KAJ4699601.1 ATP synthase subunit alpha [Melia azedarach]KAJ4699614.1 ATP synthase subunit alpha [Melia azedarach]